MYNPRGFASPIDGKPIGTDRAAARFVDARRHARTSGRAERLARITAI
jgi:hypothetical protein